MNHRGTPKQIALVLLRMGRDLERELKSAETQAALSGLSVARKLSSGRLTSRQLRKMGSPYATRNPRPPGDPAVINRQSGRFYQGWRVVAPRNQGAHTITRLENTSAHARYLHAGTRKMIARPILSRIREGISRERERLWRAALKRIVGD